jgi:hypothetical protein
MTVVDRLLLAAVITLSVVEDSGDFPVLRIAVLANLPVTASCCFLVPDGLSGH